MRHYHRCSGEAALVRTCCFELHVLINFYISPSQIMALNIMAGGFPLLSRSDNSSVYATLIILINIIVFFKSVIFNPLAYSGVSKVPCLGNSATDQEDIEWTCEDCDAKNKRRQPKHNRPVPCRACGYSYEWHDHRAATLADIDSQA